MVALVEGIDRRLPVAVPFNGDITRQCHLAEVVRLKVRANRVQVVTQAAGIGIQAEPDQPVPRLARQLADAVACGRALRERVKVGYALERAVQIIIPMVILALERVGAASALGAQTVAAVLTHVVEGANRAILLPHDEHRFAADVGADEIAGLTQVLLDTTEQPYLRPHPLPLQPHEVGGRVALLGDNVVAQVRIIGLGHGRDGTFLGLDAPDLAVGRRA